MSGNLRESSRKSEKSLVEKVRKRDAMRLTGEF
jgi:hypothetical protein